MMNNKGFTLIEILIVLVLLSLVTGFVFIFLGTTISSKKEDMYKLMKDNIISAGYDYVNEYTLETIECDFSFEQSNKFSASYLQNMGFLKKLDSPIDGKYLGYCLILEANMSNGVAVINLIDNCY